MTCSHCGAAVAEGATFCPSCGEMVLAAPPPPPASPTPSPQRPTPPQPQVVPVPQRPTRQRAPQQAPRSRTRQPAPAPARSSTRQQPGAYPGGGTASGPVGAGGSTPGGYGSGGRGSGGGYPPSGRAPRRSPDPRGQTRGGSGCGTMLLRLIVLALAIPVVLAVGLYLLARGALSGDVPQAAPGASSSSPAVASPETTSTPTSEVTTPATTGSDVPTATPATTGAASASAYPAAEITGHECSRTGTGPYAATAAGNDRTSCAFAAAVQQAYLAAGGDGSAITVTAHSQARQADIDLVCLGRQPVQCTSASGAVVYLYGGRAVTS